MRRPVLAMASTRLQRRPGCRWRDRLSKSPAVTASSLMKSKPQDEKSSTIESMYSCAPGLVKSILSW